ncbi:hypothetical protein LTR62_001597 [Meristemomyces frigidus]|uniref:Glutathione S-transferase n=1 Tax=Meristemomyces frigidus TaxID=1508187 RepID=A0AAN7YG73_9PEZI|nr:hypothetical protein LTR62_001597 [Meristemomyces frigidus]
MTTNGTANGTSATNGHTTHNMQPKITLYTNHLCPYAQRAHITLDELNLQYEEILIDLSTPRPQWYLDINPRGLVPSIKYSVPGVTDQEEILTESAIVAQFLCDSFPSHLLPASKESPTSALTRARIAFFCDTWSSKIAPSQMTIMSAKTAEEKDAKIDDWIKVLEKEMEPLLANAKPFFGGSEQLTFAEVFTAPFVQRWYSLSRDGEMMPASLAEKLDALPYFGAWAKAMLGHKSVTRIFNEEKFLEGMRARVEKMRAAAQAGGK